MTGMGAPGGVAPPQEAGWGPATWKATCGDVQLVGATRAGTDEGCGTAPATFAGVGVTPFADECADGEPAETSAAAGTAA
ncbi:MAG: hypothetical protein L3K00_04900 [Thermoplasmata archaeon]|nr:hypothetical protein [Thermoplasmata archaeon]